MAKKQRPAKINKVMTKGYAEILLAPADWTCELNCAVCPENPCPHVHKNCDRAMAECYDDVRRGDLVLVEPAKGYDTKYARSAYIMVPIAFVLGCAFGRSMHYDLANTLVMGGLMAVLSFLLAWLMNKQARMRRVIEWRMVDVLRETARVIQKKKKK